MKWSVHPAKQRRSKTIFSLIFIVAFFIYIAVFFGIFWCILGFVIFFISLHAYYFPTHYEVNDKVVIIKSIFTTQRRELKEFKKLYKGKNGILLSPFKHKTFLNQFRGVFLYLPDKRDEIVDYVNKVMIASQEESNSKADREKDKVN